MTWNPQSWRSYPVVQMPEYLDNQELKSVEKKLALKPPLVFAGEVQLLRNALSIYDIDDHLISELN